MHTLLALCLCFGGDMESATYATKSTEAIVKAAHPTAKSVNVKRYDFQYPKVGRIDLVATVEYSGALTKKLYLATVVIKIDSEGKWQILGVDYKDNNNIPGNLNNIQKAIKELNSGK